MRYYRNFIGSFFGFGKPIIAEPSMDDIAGIPAMRIKILQTIADSSVLEDILFKGDPEARDRSANMRIKAEKMANYQERLLHVNGYYGPVSFSAMHEIEQEMAEDWWLQNV